MWLSNKFVGKYMRMAKQLGEDNNPCHSRQIGVVLVHVYDDGGSKVVGTGYNGPPRGTPHCDTREYLRDIFWPQLTDQEKRHALKMFGCFDDDPIEGSDAKDIFLDNATGCGKCPRRLVGARSGERLELCSCAHAETNAITNAAEDLHGCWAFCWCGVACWECAKLMINAGIKRAYFIDGGGADYSFGSRWLFSKAGLHIEVHKPEVYLLG